MLRVLVSQDVAPANHREWELEDTSVNGCAVFRVPDYEGVIFSESRKVPIVRGESQSLDSNLHAFEDSNRLLLCIVPKDDGSIGKLLENSAKLACGHILTRA